MTPLTIDYTESLTVTSCWCGIHLAIPDNLYRNAHDHGTDVYCPLGHKFGWHETEADRLKAKLERAQKDRDFHQHCREQAEADARAQKGRATRYKNDRDRLKRRVTAGVCPCCQRHFKQVEAHMKRKHPEVFAQPIEAEA